MASDTLTQQRPAARKQRAAPVPLPPTEIRAARREELEQVLDVRSQAFGMPREHWPPLNSVPEEELRRLRVVVRDGTVVSCLEIKAAQVHVGEAALPMGGVSHVATLTAERNKGYASALMRDTLRTMRSQGLCTSVLFPFSFRYYRKFGYELAGNHCQFWCRPHNLPVFSEHAACRPAVPADIPRLAALYKETARRRSCALVRDEERWRGLLGSPGYRVIVYDREGVAGYLIARDSQDHYGGCLLALEELCVESSEARRGLLGYLARYSGEAIEWCASCTDLTESGVLRSVAPLREGFKPRGIATVRPMFQFRVVDILAALKARAPVYAGINGELSLLIRDDLVAENQEPIAISSSDGTVQILAGQRTEHLLEGDIRAFSQLFCGYLSPAEAVSQGLLQASSPEALNVAEDFFPRLEPFIPQMDRF
jgi:predicted acetyltransferase